MHVVCKIQGSDQKASVFNQEKKVILYIKMHNILDFINMILVLQLFFSIHPSKIIVYYNFQIEIISNYGNEN